MKQFLRAVALWLGVLEGLTSWTGTLGLSWGNRWLGVLLALATLGRRRPRPLALLTAAPVALAAQVALASVRRGGLNPKLRLLPGTYGDRKIERLDIPGTHGPVPALHIVPVGGARAAVCVAHGSGCDKTFYAWRLADVLVAQGLAVLLVDLDGHGDSPRPQAFPTIIESVAAPARWLQARYARVALLGTSLGGSVTARAIADGTTCDAVVLWGTPPQLRLTQAAYRRTQIVEALRIARLPLLHLFRDGSPYHIVRAWQTSGIRAHIGTWDLFDALDLLGSLATVRARAGRPPLLLVYAGRDAVLRPGAAAEVRQASAGWGEFRLVRRASHVSLAIEPETINLTARWLGEQLGRA